MTYAFVTQDRVCFVLDLMNGGDLHYHLTQHGCFSGNLLTGKPWIIGGFTRWYCPGKPRLTGKIKRPF